MTRGVLAALVVLVVLACDASACDVGDDLEPVPRSTRRTGALSPEEQGRIVLLHNRCRRTVRPAAQPPLEPLRWDDALAAQAKRWVRECRFEHSDTQHGENLAFATNAPVDGIVALWLGEARHYVLATNRCLEEPCGHYTQVVWRRTDALGCAAARCPFGRYLVCQYAPPGNWRGKKPY